MARIYINRLHKAKFLEQCLAHHKSSISRIQYGKTELNPDNRLGHSNSYPYAVFNFTKIGNAKEKKDLKTCFLNRIYFMGLVKGFYLMCSSRGITFILQKKVPDK